jgi:general secretion pathway protein D
MALALCASGLLSSCASTAPPAAAEATAASGSASAAVTGQPGEQRAGGLASSARELAASTVQDKAEPVLYRGTDQLVALPARQEPIRLVGKDVSLNFEQAPLAEVAHAILSDILKLDYAVDHPINGKVTLRTRTPVPRDQLLGVLESLLMANDALMIRGSDGRLLITGSKQGSRMSPRISNPYNTGAGFDTVVVPLQYISASGMAEILGPMADESALLRVDNARNLLMLAGTRAQLDGWLDIIATFDVDMLKGMSVGLFPLENSSVEEVEEALAGLLGSDRGGDKGGAGLAQMVRIIPMQRLNSILVVTPRAQYLDSVKTWVERLDGTPDANFEKRLYVYPVQNTTANRLAELLTSIYSGGGQTTSGSQGQTRSNRGSGSGRGAGVAPGLSPETLGSSSSGRSSASGRAGSGSLGSSGSSRAAGSSGSSGMGGGTTGFSNNAESSSIGTAASLSDGSQLNDVRVVADDENNALMIHATGKQYGIIAAALEQLDVVATQVIIEASIMEVSLTDELSYGLEWTFKNGIGNNYSGVGLLADAAVPARAAPGFSYTVTNSIGDISAVLNALAEQSLINIISTPSVMVLDNHTAYIQVGEQVPVRAGQSISDGGTTTENIQYRDTGVKLTVKPSVNAGGLVTMDIEQSVTDIGIIEATTGQRRFLERNIMSRVAVRSNESVVLGGLIRENATAGSSGLPVLSKIPVLGALFGSVNEESVRTELLVIITPRALYNESELRDISREMRSQVRHMELIELPPGK